MSAPIDLLFQLSESDLEPTARSGKPKLTQQWFSLKELQDIHPNREAPGQRPLAAAQGTAIL